MQHAACGALWSVPEVLNRELTAFYFPTNSMTFLETMKIGAGYLLALTG
jgi:hypothetical protein